MTCKCDSCLDLLEREVAQLKEEAKKEYELRCLLEKECEKYRVLASSIHAELDYLHNSNMMDQSAKHFVEIRAMKVRIGRARDKIKDMPDELRRLAPYLARWQSELLAWAGRSAEEVMGILSGVGEEGYVPANNGAPAADKALADLAYRIAEAVRPYSSRK